MALFSFSLIFPHRFAEEERNGFLSRYVRDGFEIGAEAPMPLCVCAPFRTLKIEICSGLVHGTTWFVGYKNETLICGRPHTSRVCRR